MTAGWLLQFVGLAAIYAVIVTFVVTMLAQSCHLLSKKRSTPLFLVTFFFIFLTQHPFPHPAQLKCPVLSAEPQLSLFKFWDTVILLYQNDATATNWLSNKTILATLMNFLICVAIGTALSRHVTKIWIAVIFGMTLTLLVELTQLTGFWGLYPCAYRQFNVDDLLLNALGTMVGFIVTMVPRKI